MFYLLVVSIITSTISLPGRMTSCVTCWAPPPCKWGVHCWRPACVFRHEGEQRKQVVEELAAYWKIRRECLLPLQVMMHLMSMRVLVNSVTLSKKLTL